MRLVLATVAALVVVATGCGGVENETNLAKAVERTEATGSSRLEVRAAVKEGDSRLDLMCEGAADYDRARLRLACNQGFGDMIAIGDTLYMTSDAFGVRLPDKRWVKVPLDETAPLRNFSPETLLRMLRDASLETARIGEETVRQVTTVRYRLTVNCDEAQITCPGTTAPVDVWIDDEGLVLKIELEEAGNPATIEFFDFGIEVEIEPPPADQVAEPGEGWTGYGPPQDPNAPPCSEGDGTPISKERALAALRSHGFSVRIDDCVGGSGVVAGFTNGDDTGDALAREGLLFCHLRSSPGVGAPKTVVRRGVDGGDAELELANLSCSILADSPNAEAKIRPLEQAFEELERAIRP